MKPEPFFRFFSLSQAMAAVSIILFISSLLKINLQYFNNIFFWHSCLRIFREFWWFLVSFSAGGVPLESQGVPLDPRGCPGLLFGCILVGFWAPLGGPWGHFSVLVSRCVFGAALERGFERFWLHVGSLLGALLELFCFRIIVLLVRLFEKIICSNKLIFKQ